MVRLHAQMLMVEGCISLDTEHEEATKEHCNGRWHQNCTDAVRGRKEGESARGPGAWSDSVDSEVCGSNSRPDSVNGAWPTPLSIITLVWILHGICARDAAQWRDALAFLLVCARLSNWHNATWCATISMASAYAIASGICPHSVATGFAISAWRWPTFPPKKTDEALLQTLEEIHVWTRDNGRQLKKMGA